MTHRTMSKRSYHRATSRSLVLVLLSVSDYSSSITHCFFSSHNIMCNTNIPVNKNVLSMSLNVYYMSHYLLFQSWDGKDKRVYVCLCV